MKPTINPAGLYRIDLWRGCYLLLTSQEYYNGLKRGKADRRRQSTDSRIQSEGSLLEVIEEKERSEEI
ncbi:MAG: hypothetical protein A2139_14235 [Desulfobacca sp. RBG_16_60_12]|nr:MAG: hypothetical protein A2139_14235 [Desulfobacca sp. RBG_16_60_12]